MKLAIKIDANSNVTSAASENVLLYAKRVRCHEVGGSNRPQDASYRAGTSREGHGNVIG